MAENRLVKRAERRQGMFGKAWTEIGRLAMMVRDGRSFDTLSSEELGMRPMWRDAATPTRAAAMDQVQKGISAGVLTPTGDYTMKLLSMSPQDKEMLRKDRARDSTSALQRLVSTSGVLDEPSAPDVGVDGGLNAD